MSNVDTLVAKGAQIVGGDLILRHKVMGSFRHGDFVLSLEGQAELEVIDVVEIKKPRAKKVEAATPLLADEVAAADDGVQVEA